MDEKKQSSTAKLEEALHPQVGNGASWVNAPHESQLREVDPSKKLEPKLLDEQQLAAIARQWEDDLNSDGTPVESVESVNGEEPAVIPEVETPIAPQDQVQAIEEEEIVPAPLKPVKEKVKASKRVRKVAQKEEEKAAKNNRLQREQFAPSSDETLTPFTQWLKGLKGSEYVHPYEDDFAFRQAEGPVREGISETYADLLAQQGYKDQAIDMYRRLMEKFPEKNRFFAAKIEALQ
jgi:hypothetical protein